MWAYAQCDGCRLNIGGALCWMLIQEIAKMSLWCNLRLKKLHAVLSNYKADVYESWQL